MDWFYYADENTHALSQTETGWATLSDAEKVAVIIDHDDGVRIWSHGGYPSDYEIHDGVVYRANINDQDRPSLEISPVNELVEDTEWLQDYHWESDGEGEDGE